MNFVVLSAALSGANAALYAGSRILFSLSRTGWAPASLGRVNHSGSPQFAVVASSYGILVALALALWAPQNAFRYLIGAAFTGMILRPAGFPRRPYPLSPPPVPATTRRPASALSARQLGVPARLLVLVTIATIQTWLSPIVNLWSGLTCLAILVAAYLLLKSHQKA